MKVSYYLRLHVILRWGLSILVLISLSIQHVLFDQKGTAVKSKTLN